MNEACAVIAVVGALGWFVLGFFFGRRLGVRPDARCENCSEVGLCVREGCLTYLWGEAEEEQRLSREVSVAMAREVLSTPESRGGR